MNIHTNIIEYKEFDNTFNNYLILEIYGDKINHVILNTIRRTILELIPTYAFYKDDIIITSNTSIFNNDLMRLRLSQFPVIGIENERKNLEKIYDLEYDATLSLYEQKNEDIDIIQKKEQEIKFEKSQNLIMYINVKNTTNDILNVTTANNFVNYKYKGVNIDSPYKKDLLIIKLKPNEEFICSCSSSLHIGLKNSIYMPTSVCVYSEIDENDISDSESESDIKEKNPKPKSKSNNKKSSDTTSNYKKYNLNIESLKQLTEFEIIIRACTIIEIKLNSFLDIIIDKIDKYKSNSNNDSHELLEYENVIEDHRIKGIIKIENESHTYGNIICRSLQDHHNIEYAANIVDNLLKKEVTIAYKTDGTDIIKIIKESINDIKNIFKTIRNQIDKINK